MWLTFYCIVFILLFVNISVAGKTVALILARGGSRAIRLKNLKIVGGVSLLQRAVNTAKFAGIQEVVVSTDHPLIALEASENGAQVFRRSWITATDWAPSIWGAAEYLSKEPELSILVLLQATSPFIRSEHLQAALSRIHGYDCVFSVRRSHTLRWKELDGVVCPINFKTESRPRRQDWSGELLETGAFYVTRRHLIEKGYFQNNNCTVIEVTSIYESLEVDTNHDLELANVLVHMNFLV